MITVRALRALLKPAAITLLACGGGEPQPASGAQTGARDGRDEAESPPDTKGEASRGCELPADCKSVRTVPITIDACCTELVSCGFKLDEDPRQRESARVALGAEPGEICIERSRYYLIFPGSEEQRVQVEDGDDLLLSTDCESTAMLSFSFIGCCLPNNQCGVSTYGVHDTLAVIVGEDEPFTHLQCVTVAELNRQLADSSLAGLAHFRATEGSCDYAALDARLPREPEL